MKDYCVELALKQPNNNTKLNVMREYLQAYVLRVLHAKGMFQSCAFVGGTALRFLYDLPRFSEDLDFSAPSPESYSFTDLMASIKQELTLAGYLVDVTYNDSKTVQSAFVKFEGLLYATGLSPMKSQKFSIKIEIDTRPPQGAQLTTQIINKYFPIAFLAYDTPSLLAGKCHALLSRKYTKGRDFYDISWYLSRFKNITPNLNLLNNALKQTGNPITDVSQENWRIILHRVIEQADWGKIYADVVNFLENPSDMEIFTKANTLKLLE